MVGREGIQQKQWDMCKSAVDAQNVNWITSSQLCAALQVYSSSSSGCIFSMIFLLKEATEFGKWKKNQKRGLIQYSGRQIAGNCEVNEGQNTPDQSPVFNKIFSDFVGVITTTLQE